MKAQLVAAAFLPLAACATAAQSRAEQVASCEKMEAEMGVQHTHDHAEAKAMGASSMNLSQDQCRRILAGE